MIKRTHKRTSKKYFDRKGLRNSSPWLEWNKPTHGKLQQFYSIVGAILVCDSRHPVPRSMSSTDLQHWLPVQEGSPACCVERYTSCVYCQSKHTNILPESWGLTQHKAYVGSKHLGLLKYLSSNSTSLFPGSITTVPSS